MVTVRAEEEGQGEGAPRAAQGEKERRIAPEQTMSADHVNTVRGAAGSDTNGDMGMEESYAIGWALTAMVPFAKRRDLGTLGGKLQESGCYG